MNNYPEIQASVALAAANCKLIEPNCRIPKRSLNSAMVIRHAVSWIAFSVLLLNLTTPSASPQSSGDLTQRSLEDLMNIDVTSASKKEQKISQVAGAIFVITQEDIRRSGATNIPDLLRMVPGLEVAQTNAHTWAVSARGFNGEFSNKLLVMLDGRSVYTPTFSGVYWNVFDLPMEEIERIEVIRGPGGTAWGANAVNGVINVISKDADETQGLSVVADSGLPGQGPNSVAYGGTLAGHGHYRSFIKYLDENHLTLSNGGPAVDQWHVLRGGFRGDVNISPSSHLMVQGDMYAGRQGNNLSTNYFGLPFPAVLNARVESSLGGGYLQSEWKHFSSTGMEATVHLSYDRYRRTEVIRETRDTFNADFQNHLAIGPRQDIVWGFGYRYSTSVSDQGISVYLTPADLNTQLFSAFAQDEIQVVPNHLSLTAGAKLEHNYYTGFGVMPNLRANWKMNDHRTAWAAISRAIRTPSSIDTAIAGNPGSFVQSGIPVSVLLVGNPAFKDETVVDYEAGSRTAISDRCSMDLALFFNTYDNLRTLETAAPVFSTTPYPHVTSTSHYGNEMHGETHGLELATNLKIVDRWTLSPGYALELLHMHLYPVSTDTTSVASLQGSAPRNQAQLRSHLELPHQLTWDVSGAFVDRLRAQSIPSYTRLDSQLGWRHGTHLQLNLVGQNLLHNQHNEFADPNEDVAPSQIKRSAFARMTVWF
jgi:iron complex outermembrane receptor protein